MSRNNPKDLLQHVPFDISVEALAGWMVENGKEVSDSGQILVRPLGHNGRAVAREVQGFAGVNYDAEGKELLYLDINREGIFDSLPEMLLLCPPSNGDDAIEKAQDLAGQKEKARRFFLPFEEVLYQARIAAEVRERNALKSLAKQFLQIFNLQTSSEMEKTSLEQRLSFALALPLLKQVVGNLDQTRSLLETVLRKSVTITLAPPPAYAIPEAQQSGVGEALLGVDLVSGDFFSDGIRSLRVTVYDITPDEVERWLPGGSLRRMVEEHLFPRLLPVEENVMLNIEVSGTGSDLILGEDQTCSTLGYTTILS